MTADTQTPGRTSRAETRPDGLSTAALICGIASFVPLTPPVITPLAAIVLGLLSRRLPTSDGGSRRSSRALTGIVLGSVSLGILITICVVYFGVLGYPLPHLSRYHPGH